ncbi:MAG: hypothetical protein OXT69_02420 [Candidatus Poribacteria bacterium]|nr:hypothetical protein [Candidatus Poribacteria bacterium]
MKLRPFYRIGSVLTAALWGMLGVLTGWAAVSSNGELNVLGDPSGQVPTASEPTLILTLLIDRSQAEAGEEVKSVELSLPAGFSVRSPESAEDVRIDGVSVPFEAVVTDAFIRFVLEDEIDNFQSSLFEAVFKVRTPDLPRTGALFRVSLRNLDNLQIGEFVQPGEIDGDPLNNNDYTLDVIPNTPPATPTGFTAQADPTGENDVLLKWERVDDTEVQGYFIYRDGAPIDLPDPNASQFRDVNVSPGTHSYAIASYKIRILASPLSPSRAVFVRPDTRAPDPPANAVAAQAAQNVELTWSASPSPDAARYDILFGLIGETPVEIGKVEPEQGAETLLFTHHRPRLEIGWMRYAVVAVDEAGNRSEPAEARLPNFAAPFPNPFTPLGSDPSFRQATFPRRALNAAEGNLIVRVFDLRGREVWTSEPTDGNAVWNGRDQNGTLAASGIYIYQMRIGLNVSIGTIVLIR